MPFILSPVLFAPILFLSLSLSLSVFPLLYLVTYPNFLLLQMKCLQQYQIIYSVEIPRIRLARPMGVQNVKDFCTYYQLTSRKTVWIFTQFQFPFLTPFWKILLYCNKYSPSFNMDVRAMWSQSITLSQGNSSNTSWFIIRSYVFIVPSSKDLVLQQFFSSPELDIKPFQHPKWQIISSSKKSNIPLNLWYNCVNNISVRLHNVHWKSLDTNTLLLSVH